MRFLMLTCTVGLLSGGWDLGWHQYTTSSHATTLESNKSATSLPSPITTTRSTPSMPESTRCSWPLHQVPTSPNCSPYFLNTESSPTQVHCQRLRVASLLLAT